MGSFTFSEILTILIVILIVFGPRRLPELARRAGELVAKTRDATRSVTQTLEREYGDQAQPFRDLKEHVDGVRDDLRNVTSTMMGSEAASPSDDAGAPGAEIVEPVSITDIGPMPGDGEDGHQTGEDVTDPGREDREPDQGDDRSA